MKTKQINKTPKCKNTSFKNGVRKIPTKLFFEKVIFPWNSYIYEKKN